MHCGHIISTVCSRWIFKGLLTLALVSCLTFDFFVVGDSTVDQAALNSWRLGDNRDVVNKEITGVKENEEEKGENIESKLEAAIINEKLRRLSESVDPDDEEDTKVNEEYPNYLDLKDLEVEVDSDEDTEKRGRFFNADLGKRAMMRGDLGKRAMMRGDLGKRAMMRGDLGKRAMMRGDLGKRAMMRSDLGKRAMMRSDLGKRAMMRGDLGKRAMMRGDLGKRAMMRGDLGKRAGDDIDNSKLISESGDDWTDDGNNPVWKRPMFRSDLGKRGLMSSRRVFRADLGK